jgi:hypothetical protein
MGDFIYAEPKPSVFGLFRWDAAGRTPTSPPLPTGERTRLWRRASGWNFPEARPTRPSPTISPRIPSFSSCSDTTLQLRDQNGVIVKENDEWERGQKMEIQATGLQPSDPKEAAVLVTLQPGQYTAQVRGKPEGTGIGVVQVFFLQ